MKFVKHINRCVLILSFFALGATAGAQTLENYQKQAAEENPGLQADYKEFEAAVQRVSKVGSLPNPTLSLGYFLSPVETRVGPQQARISLSQMFPWFGSLKASEARLAEEAEAKYQSFLDSRNRMFLQVANVWYPLVETDQKIELEQRNIDLLLNLKEFALQQFESGKSPMSDVLRVEISISAAETNLEILKQERRGLEARFNALLNRDSDEDVKVDAELSIEGLGDLQAADSLLEDNPRLAEIDRKIESTKHAEEAARKSGLPGFGLGLDYVVVGERSDVDLPDNGKDAVMPMVSVSLPIFRKQYKAARQEAQLMRESFELRKEDVKNTLRADLESAQVQVYQKAELAQLYEKQIVETGHVLELLQEEYANSGADFDEVIRMQQQLISYTKLRAEALAGFHAALARIRYVTAADL